MNHHEIQQFHFPVTGETVRTVTGPDGEPWFIGTDVARVLGYKKPGKAVLDHCKCPERFNINSAPNQGSIPGNPWHSIIPERDVYRLVFKSNLPQAEVFEEWVVGEVLPMIRRTGMYMHEDIYQKLMDDPKQLGQMLLDYGKAKDELEETRERLDEAIRTKAEINNKKTATAMGTASAAVRRERKIREELEEYRQKYEMSQMRTVASQMPTIRKYFRAINRGCLSGTSGPC